jgi:hypothetical protein
MDCMSSDKTFFPFLSTIAKAWNLVANIPITLMAVLCDGWSPFFAVLMPWLSWTDNLSGGITSTVLLTNNRELGADSRHAVFQGC